MRRFSACLGVGAMFLALLTAPLYHFHDRDDHGNSVSLVHAHFPETAEAESHDHGDEFEVPHSHGQARWIDVFTLQAPPEGFEVGIDRSEKVSRPVLEERETVLIAPAPRAHSPPDRRLSNPRSPPSI